LRFDGAPTSTVADDLAQYRHKLALAAPVLAEGLTGADRALRERAAVRARALPLLDIPFFAGKRDTDGVRRCIARVRSELLGHVE
jgi:hypothetical protein